MPRDKGRILTEGLFAGVIGYGVVLLVVSAFDILGGRSPFHTVATLGSVLFFGLREPSELVIWAGPVLAYNGAHLLVFLLFGWFMAWLTSLAERGEQMWYVSLVAFLIVAPHVIGLPIWYTTPLRQVVSIWGVLTATTLAALAMTIYLWRAHPRLRAEVAAGDRGADADERVPAAQAPRTARMPEDRP